MLRAHPDKTNNRNDENAKRLNDARDRAKQMYYSFDRETARIIKDYENKKRKREVFRIVQRIYKNHYENSFAVDRDGPFEKEMEECPTDIRKEAEDIVKNGMGDTRKKLAAAEETITLLKEEIECYQAKEKADRTHLEATVEKRKILEAKLSTWISEVKEEINQQAQCLKEITEQIEKEATKESAKLDYLKAEFENFKHQAHMCGTENMNASQELEVAQQSADISPKYKKRKQDNVLSPDQSFQFKEAIANFIKNHLVPSEIGNSFVTTKQIFDVFESQVHNIPSKVSFSKQLIQNIEQSFPHVRKIRRKAHRGYFGLRLKQTSTIVTSPHENQIDSNYSLMCAFWESVDESDDEVYALAVERYLSHSSIQAIFDQIDTLDHNDRNSNAVVPYSPIGYVYAAWNPLFAGLIKIGATMRQNPYLRVVELSKAGVPEPFQLIASIPSHNPFGLEQEIHLHFDSVRKYGKKKEFFVLSIDQIVNYFHIRAIGELSRQQREYKRRPSREHKRFFSSEDASKRFKTSVAAFIKAHLVPSDNVSDFISTTRVKNLFNTHNADERVSDQLFFRELKKQISCFGFPQSVQYTERDKKMGYTGLILQ